MLRKKNATPSRPILAAWRVDSFLAQWRALVRPWRICGRRKKKNRYALTHKAQPTRASQNLAASRDATVSSFLRLAHTQSSEAKANRLVVAMSRWHGSCLARRRSRLRPRPTGVANRKERAHFFTTNKKEELEVTGRLVVYSRWRRVKKVVRIFSLSVCARRGLFVSGSRSVGSMASVGWVLSST